MSNQEKLDALRKRSAWQPESEVEGKIGSDPALLDSVLQFEGKYRELFGAHLEGISLSLPKGKSGKLLLRFQTDMTMGRLESLMRPLAASFFPGASSPLTISVKAREIKLDPSIKGDWEAFVTRCEVESAYELSIHLSTNPSFMNDLLRAEAEQRRVFKDHVVTMRIEPVFRTEDFEAERPLVSVIAHTDLAGDEYHAAIARTDPFWVKEGVPNIMLQAVPRS